MECTYEFSLNIFSFLKYKTYTLNKKYVLIIHNSGVSKFSFNSSWTEQRPSATHLL